MMVEVKGLDEVGVKAFLEFVEDNVPPNLLSVSDVLHEPDFTDVLVAWDGRVRGYLLHYWGSVEGWIMEARDRENAALLLEHTSSLPLLLDPRFLDLALTRFKDARIVRLFLMVVRRGCEVLVEPEGVERLGKDDIPDIRRLYREAGWRRRVERWLERMPVFGLRVDGELAAVAGLTAMSRYGGVLGGIYVAQRHRRKGYGARVASAATAEALKRSGLAALYVDSENSPAIRLYLKLGYDVEAERVMLLNP